VHIIILGDLSAVRKVSTGLEKGSGQSLGDDLRRNIPFLRADPLQSFPRRGSVAVLRGMLATLLLTEEHVGVLVPSRSLDDAERFVLVDPDRTEFDERPIKAAAPGPAIEPEDEPLSFRDVLVAREQEIQVRVAVARDRSSRT
jgi:hypothetical protein